MGRPTVDRKGNRITIRMNDDTYARLSMAENVSDEARKILERGLEAETLLSDSWDVLARKLGITQMELFDAVSNAVDKQVLYSKGGKLFFTRGAVLTPDYISVDSAIDGLNIPEWEKTNYKNKILKDISGGINDYSDDWA